MSRFRGRKWVYLVFWQKGTGAEIVAIVTALRVSFCFFRDAHYDANNSRDIVY